MGKYILINYNKQLIKMMLKATFAGALAVNILTPILLSFIFYEEIDHTFIYVWIILNFILFIARLVIGYLSENVLQNSPDKLKSYLLSYCCIILLSSLLHAYALFYCSFHISSLELMFMAMITISLVSGSLATLGSVYPVFALFAIFNLLPIVGIFIYVGGDIFNIFSVAVLTYTFVMLKHGYEIYSSLSENIKLKETFEERVSQSIIEIHKKEKLLREQSHLAQMGEMMSMIAHQWRQPLNAISATSTSLMIKAEMGTLSDAYVKEMAENITSYAVHLSETINDFRNFYKPNKEKSVVSFNELFLSVEKIISVSLEKHEISLVKNLGPDMQFLSYENELKQVILNLIKNAEDVLIENEIEKRQIILTTTVNESSILLSVEDNASGIDEEILEKIFEPYFSTKTKKDGTGLGLYMSKMIVEDHCGGKLSVENTLHGAKFTISVPKESLS